MYRTLIGPVLLDLLSALVLVAVVLAANTLRTKAMPLDGAPPSTGTRLDHASAAERLAHAVRFRTISDPEPGRIEREAFLGFHEFLRASYPGVHRVLTREVVNGGGLLYTWPGRDARRKAVLLAAHLDVVPVDPDTEEQWTHSPFAGHMADGYIWGRGTLDDKASVLGILEAVEQFVAAGLQPDRTVYLAFGHDEELGGYGGAAGIAELLASRGVQIEAVIDEGLAVTEGLLPGVSAPVALIGVAEKGRLTVELSVRGDPGHASVPPEHTAVGILSTAIHRLEAHPMPARLSPPARELLTTVGPTMPWLRRLALANLWLFEPLVVRQLTRSRPTNALVRSTLAVTAVQAGMADNALPAQARALVDVRLLPGDTTASVLAHVRRVIDDPRGRIRAVRGTEPSPVSSTHSATYRALAESIRAVFPDAVVAPGLGVTRTDAAHYLPIADGAYRFLPLRLGREDLRRIHGLDERIAVPHYADVIEFYVQLVTRLVAPLDATEPANWGGSR